MDWKTMLAYITGSVDRELLLRNEYLVTENRILRDQLQGRLRLLSVEADLVRRAVTQTVSGFLSHSLSRREEDQRVQFDADTNTFRGLRISAKLLNLARR